MAMPPRRVETLRPRTQARAPISAPRYVEPLPEEPYELEVTDTEADHEGWRPSGLLEWFAVAQTALPALLYLPGNQQSRAGIRAAAFVISVVAFVFWYLDRRTNDRVSHPATRWLALSVATLAFMLVHPQTESWLAGVAQITLYFAVLCPIYWVPGFVSSRRKLIRVLVILLICNGVNSGVGVLQVYDPARWLPAEFSSTISRQQIAISTYAGPNGRRVVRPPGLFDTPGAVCGAGTVAALLGLILCLEPMAWWKRLGALGFAGMGLAAIYLSHVRSSFIVALAMMIAYVGMLAVQKQRRRMVGFLGLAVGMLVLALSFATLLGGASVQDRFMSVFQGDPRDLYAETRGAQLRTAFGEVLSDYPMGAGLARWGTTANVVGTPVSRQLWAEIQPVAWMLDGGLFLTCFYSLALISALIWEVKLVFKLPDPDDRLWASAVVAANLGTLALVATFVPFATQPGLQYWFLEGLLQGAMAVKLHQSA